MSLIRKNFFKGINSLLLAVFVLIMPAKEAFAWNYVVQPGDDTASVATLTQCEVSELLLLNELQEDSALTVGQVLQIPEFISTSSVIEAVLDASTILPASETPLIEYSEAELDLLARCIFAEAGGMDYAGQVAVGAVVVNRVQNSRFPDTITEVIYAPRQFECVTNGMINKQAPQSCYDAAIAALHGADNTYGALYFWAPDLVYSAYHESLNYICTVGGHIFATDEEIGEK